VSVKRAPTLAHPLDKCLWTNPILARRGGPCWRRYTL